VNPLASSYSDRYTALYGSVYFFFSLFSFLFSLFSFLFRNDSNTSAYSFRSISLSREGNLSNFPSNYIIIRIANKWRKMDARCNKLMQVILARSVRRNAQSSCSHHARSLRTSLRGLRTRHYARTFVGDVKYIDVR